MAAEIELKAWLDDYEATKERLSSLGACERSFEKTDTYWFPINEGAPAVALPHSGLRVRRDRSEPGGGGEPQESALVTVKKRTVSGGIEVNEEREFSVSSADLFEELACDLGLFKGMYKKKSGWAWKIGQGAGLADVTAEVSMVKDLGWFLELEIVAGRPSESLVRESREALLALLDRLEVPRGKIEPRSYAALLSDRWQAR